MYVCVGGRGELLVNVGVSLFIMKKKKMGSPSNPAGKLADGVAMV